MSDNDRPPIPKERWKGPPEGPPDDERPLGHAASNDGASPSLVIAGVVLTIVGLGLLIYGLITSGSSVGANLLVLCGGLAAGVCGIALIRAVKRQPVQTEDSASGCLWTLMALAGVAMLLPGACSLLFGIGYLSEPMSGVEFFSSIYFGIFLSGWLIGAVGVGLVWWAIVGGSPKAGMMMVTGTALLLPGGYFAVFGASRIHLLLIGLPAAALGIFLLRNEWLRHLRSGQTNSGLDPRRPDHE